MAPAVGVLVNDLEVYGISFQLANVPGGSFHLWAPGSAGGEKDSSGFGVDESDVEVFGMKATGGEEAGAVSFDHKSW